MDVLIKFQIASRVYQGQYRAEARTFSFHTIVLLSSTGFSRADAETK